MAQRTDNEGPSDLAAVKIDTGIEAMGVPFDELEDASVPLGQTRRNFTLVTSLRLI